MTMTAKDQLAKLKPKHAGGRPRKDYMKYLPADWKQRITDMAAKGCSDAEIKADLMGSDGQKYSSVERIFYALKQRESEFAKCLLSAKELQKAYWEKMAREGMFTKNFNGFVWFQSMKNRFGYKDKTEIDHGISDNLFEKFSGIQNDELIKKANELIKKAGISKKLAPESPILARSPRGAV